MSREEWDEWALWDAWEEWEEWEEEKRNPCTGTGTRKKMGGGLVFEEFEGE